ncbi:DUF3150 domain-containing protein [Acidithiobacillus ferrooxidans]|nr:DUF3150 domain-containing protein [Acidithiobacillus ferrooxidans]
MKKSIVFLPELRSVSGERVLDRSLITSTDGRDLDKVLATGGTIQVLPREALKGFTTLRKAVDRELMKKGTRFFGGYLVAEEFTAEMASILSGIKEKVEDAKRALVANLASLIEQRVNDAPEWEDVIRSHAPSQEDIEESISFSWLKTPVDLADPEIEEALQGDPLAVKIAREIAQACKSQISRPAKTGRGITGLKFLEGIRDKAQALTFVDGRLGGLVSAIDIVISTAEIAKTSGHEAQRTAATVLVQGTIQVMTSPAMILKSGEEGSFKAPDPELEPESEDQVLAEEDDIVATTSPSPSREAITPLPMAAAPAANPALWSW